MPIDDDTRKNVKSTLDEDLRAHLLNEYCKDLFAVGYNMVKNIDIYDDRDPSDKKVYSKGVKESTSLVLKNGNPFFYQWK